MITKKLFARVVCWRYWKQLQRFLEGVGQLTHAGFIFLKFKIMSTNTLSKETEIRLVDFFNKTVDPESLAKAIRQINYLIALSIIRDCETFQTEKINLEKGYYWLNELAEILNPYFEVED
ncbi:hypothetical protein L1276_001865 [Flavobacterium sp. HSC-32F16]|uniref:hypothetical protein n=1 Tax=Flavobacterium sp. HSC-32F16 TaxID=2910964 RepID=UPI003531C2FA|nr:hypothetical protein [Flavobacterium sp. HSC-32F16]